MSKLVDIAELNMGQSPPSSSYNDEGIGLPFYQGKVDFGFIHPIPRKYCSSPTKIAKRGDILISVRAPVGPVNITRTECCIGRGLAAITAKTFDQLFVYFNLIYQEPNIASLGSGSTFKAINKSQLESINIPDFPLPEQRKIAYVLSTVQKAIEQQDKLIRTTTELKKALMQKLFTEGIGWLSGAETKQKQTEIGPVPESWEVTTIGEMYDFTSKPRGLNIELPVPFIPMDIVPLNEIYIEKYELRESLSSGTYVENGDLLLAKITPSFENGKQGIVSIDKPYCYATTEVIPIKGKHKISDIYYLFYYLLKDDVRKLLADKMEGSTGRQRLSKTILEKTLIPMPSFSEQKVIANIFLSIYKKLSFHQKKKSTLTALFKTLLHELMTGERRVHEIEFEALDTEVKEMSTSI
ncbi:MAG: restriction endonuclease subunit S [Clostridia bacterium]|nr:restriction endonuclease subunit S [Clostridia bacterium]